LLALIVLHVRRRGTRITVVVSRAKRGEIPFIPNGNDDKSGSMTGERVGGTTPARFIADQFLNAAMPSGNQLIFG